MSADEAAERTEDPTPRRREEARERGQVPRSQDLTAAIGMLVGLVLLDWFGPGMFQRMLDLTRDTGDLTDISGNALHLWARRAGSATLMITLPFLSLLLVLSAAGAVVQSGWVWSWKKAQPKLENLSFKKGLKKIFSLDSLARAGFGVLKFALIASVAYSSIKGDIDRLLATTWLHANGLLAACGQVVFALSLRMALILLLLGLIDYIYQRWRLEKQLKMTKQEVRDEMKRMDGDPLLKNRRRQVQMKLAMQKLGTEVPRADVVVTNPTEFAVALRYDDASMAAPRVIAKGADFLALRIRQIAQQHRVPIVQRPPLARALYAQVEVGGEVPPAYYRAVAELLAYVYQVSGKAAG